MPAPAAKDKGDSGLLIALGGPEKSMPMRGKMGSDDSEAPSNEEIEEMALDDAFAAIDSKDRASFGDAMHRFVLACMNHKGEGEGY